MTRTLIAVVLGITTMLSVSGCAGFFTIGKAETQCGAYEAMQGTKCMSIRQLYKASEGEGLSSGSEGSTPYNIEREDKKAEAEKKDSFWSKNKTDKKKPQSDAEAKATTLSAADPTPWMEKPTPIRTQPKVQRIWVAPYEDLDGDLLAPGIVYTEIEKRRWNIGEEMVMKPKALKPVQSFEGQAPMQQGFGGQNIFGQGSQMYGDQGMYQNMPQTPFVPGQPNVQGGFAGIAAQNGYPTTNNPNGFNPYTLSQNPPQNGQMPQNSRRYDGQNNLPPQNQGFGFPGSY